MRLLHHNEPATHVDVWTVEFTDSDMKKIEFTLDDKAILNNHEFNIPEALLVLSYMANQVVFKERKEERERRTEEAQAAYHQRQLRNPQGL